MECIVKYGTWNVKERSAAAEAALRRSGYGPLTAAVLAARGYDTPEKARSFLLADGPLEDPFVLQDMDKAAGRIRRALAQGEAIAVFGDYDVDGITATCLLTEFLQSQGGNVTYYIPARIEEGYGLNQAAIASLQARGVSLIVTVDCGITADEEAAYCREQGIDLIITDHHECRDVLPPAVAVVDPHRKDQPGPTRCLAGVGVAFKLAAAIVGSQEAILQRFADLLCLGTVADVMPLTGENRTFVIRGLQALAENLRPGLAALMAECSCDGHCLTASTIGYTLAPRINAAGRMGKVTLASELFLTRDESKARDLARRLCALNRQRQEVEAEIYQEALSMLARDGAGNAIVLAGEHWHQGVIGIVASRLAEEFACPAYLICLDGEKGKASSRSYGGFNLFASLEAQSARLESYGGHELAAGFTILRREIDTFRTAVDAMARDFAASGQRKAALEIDCAIDPALLTESNILALDQLEPCGAGCPKPVFFLDGLTVEQLSEVGGGRHLRLRLSGSGHSFGAIFFSTTALRAGVAVGDRVEIAFTPQINEFRGVKSVQLNLVDIRPDRESRQRSGAGRALYDKFTAGQPLTPEEAAALTPDRADFTALWRYLVAQAKANQVQEDISCMSRKLARAGSPMPPGRIRICLDVLEERGLLTKEVVRERSRIRLCAPKGKKVNLGDSPILQTLKDQKAGD